MKDFFYICAGHLTDRGFAIPDKDEAAAAEARKKKAELDAEIALVKKEYAEKIKKKADKKASKDKDGKDKSKGDDKQEKEEDKSDEKELEDKVRPQTIICHNPLLSSSLTPHPRSSPWRRAKRHPYPESMTDHGSTAYTSMLSHLSACGEFQASSKSYSQLPAIRMIES